MGDLAKWEVHGPIETLRKESFTWDTKQNNWQPIAFLTVASFRPDGTISTTETHNANGSVQHSRWIYGGTGQLTESDSWMNDDPVDQTIYIYDAARRPIRTEYVSSKGTRTDIETFSYDADGKKTKVRFLPLKPLRHASPASPAEPSCITRSRALTQRTAHPEQ